MKKLLQSLFILLFVASSAMAQDRTITGTVTDKADGSPLPGVTVRVAGTNAGTTTGANGKYAVNVPASATKLEFSYLGYLSQTATITSSNVVDLSLVGDSKALSEVVVTALGISRESKALGYAVGKVSPDQILQKSEPDILKTLQGKVAGVDIRTSQGTPGAATRIQIRGNSSFFGDSQPLIVVDGIPYSNDQITTSSQTSGGGAYGSGIANLDPNDIASMEVLKGSAAGALYGSRASNGVLLITTKSGNAKRSTKGFEVSYRSSASIEQVANLPVYQNLYGAGSQGNYSASNGSWGPAFSSRSTIPAWDPYVKAYPELFPAGSTVPYVAYPNNVKDLFKNGSLFENSITLNGGNEKTAFSMTASNVDQGGYVDNSTYNRSNISLGGSTKLDMGLNVRGNLSYTRSNQMGGTFGENQVDGAASQFARTLFLARNWDLNLPYQDKLGNNLEPLGGGQFDNPRWSARNNTVNTYEERIIANMHADMKLTDWAHVDFGLGSNVNYLKRKEVTEISSRAAEGLGRIVLDDYRKQEIESNLFFTFTPKVISPDFSFRAITGFSYNQRSTDQQSFTGNKFINRGIYNLTNTSQQIFDGDDFERRRLMGLYGEASLGYKGWAYVTFTGRNDWSSTLPVNNRSYFYPGVSGSLIFTDALKIESKVLDFGKIRLGYAKVGRDAEPYNLYDIYRNGTSFLGQPIAYLDGVYHNVDLKPEFTKEFEIGTQLSFFNKLVELDFTYYNKNSTNLIAPISTGNSTGYGSYYTNFGKINNRGQEIELTVRPFRGDFSWSVNSSFTRNRNIVKETAEGLVRFTTESVLTGIAPYIEKNMPFNYLRGTVSKRDSEGNLLINPATGGMIEDTEEAMIGNPNPDFKLGVTNTFSYKGLSLGILFDMTKGGSIYSTTIMNLLGRGVTKDTEVRDRLYVIPGVYGDPITGQPILDASGNKIPNTVGLTQNDLWFSPDPTIGQTFAINTASEWNVYDATVYRLREITLGYAIPKNLYKKLPIGSINVSVTGRNLWYLAPNVPKYTRFDPEVNSYGSGSAQGIELSAAPTAKRYGFNLSVTF